MRIVYVFDDSKAPDAPHPYMFRAPSIFARILCRLVPDLDYALNWWTDEEIEAAGAAFMATLDTTI